MLERIADGRTDLVFDYLAAGHAANATDADGTSLLQWCAYYGDVSAIKHLLAHGETLASMGDNLDLNGAAFHGHWQLCQFLIEQGADVNHPLPDTHETPLHAALCKPNSATHALVIKVLLAAGANPNCVTAPNVETGGFMRDCRTKGETPLHRAAAFGTEAVIQLLLDAGAVIDARDMNGDTPLSWGSWYTRPDAILRKLCYGSFYIRPERQTMEAYLRGAPHVG
ncbi:MAG: ankyrin repeat domain-containing protein [Acidobacteria bacterium]|nr:ankyrin repeat domain-containing protein [Acidobacteriota bacterium]